MNFYVLRCIYIQFVRQSAPKSAPKQAIYSALVATWHFLLECSLNLLHYFGVEFHRFS